MEKKTKRTKIMEETIKMAESLGFVYKADGREKWKDWVTFTYPGTNTYVIYIDVAGTGDITKRLGDELVKCGKIILRQKIHDEFSLTNYDD
jgi:hypothetical protein